MDYKDLIQLAMDAMKNSYSPYSKFKVGAALITDDDAVYTGTNVENCTFGASVCAERVAIFKAVSDGHRKIKAIAIISDSPDDFVYPCGTCRQVIAEFGDKDTIIICGKNLEEFKTYNIYQLLPYPFRFRFDF